MTALHNLRILIADDHELVRKGIRALLASRTEWRVCAEAATGREVIALAAEHRPHVVIMDIAMPELNGLEATRKIRKMLPRTQVLILSLHYSDQLVREVVDSGARAYLLKSDISRDLIAAIDALSKNQSFFTSDAARILLEGFCNRSSAAAPPLIRESLTTREREIAQLLAEGKSCKLVATVLGISLKTAETHRAHIMRKLNIHSVSDLVRYAVRNKIIEA